MIPSAVPGDHHTTTADPEAAVTSLTDHDLAILAARLTDPNVTALPWVTDSFEIFQAHPTGIENMGVWVAESCDPDTVDGGSANAALIVAAVNALPGLLAEVKRLRAQLADYTRPIAACFGCHHPAPWHIGELGSTERACTQHACGCTNLTREA